MPFETALSGIRAASNDLSVTGNNIANASTKGFKTSRAEFGDVYSTSVMGAGSNPVGSGVRLQNVAQQFSQGSVAITENELDLAINGDGFFVVKNGGEQLYTRAGTFGMDQHGYIVTNTGARLQGYPADDTGNVTGIQNDIHIPESNIAPRTTTSVSSVLNLDAGEPVLELPFNPGNGSTYNSATSMTIYDSLGAPHVLTQYYVRQPQAPDDPTPSNGWDLHVGIDGTEVQLDAPLAVQFNQDGTMVPPTEQITIPWPDGYVGEPIALNLEGTTQFHSSFSVNDVGQDGYPTGRLSGLNIDGSGIIFARFTNGESKILGQVVLADFANTQGLQPVGNTMWAENHESGQPKIGAPGSGPLGAIQSGALEESNVDLSEQLVNLIIAQRNYQASAKTIETTNQVTQTILNIR